MRVISGLAGGIRLAAPLGREVRPTSDRVKESLFSSLGDVRGWTVVDLFAGSGALGLEALSRGAARVVLIDNNPRSLSCIRLNLAAVLHAAPDLDGQATVLQASAADAPRLLAELTGKVDLLLADPPYRPDEHQYGAERLLLDESLARWADRALLVVEHAVETPLPWHPRACWRLLRKRPFGSRCLSYGRQAVGPEER